MHKKVSLRKVYDDINEQDTSFLDCKHKHMMKRVPPPDKFRSCTIWLHIEFHGFTSRINSKGYHSLVPGLISIFFGDSVGPFNLDDSISDGKKTDMNDQPWMICKRKNIIINRFQMSLKIQSTYLQQIQSLKKSMQEFIKSNKAYSNIANSTWKYQILTKGFQEKHSCHFSFSKLCYAPCTQTIFLIHMFYII